MNKYNTERQKTQDFLYISNIKMLFSRGQIADSESQKKRRGG